uniref:Uncharacterized protein n=1 Tax=Arion vulgaris TaxID=1028688 RepID=A0A0B7A4R0_9EUPU
MRSYEKKLSANIYIYIKNVSKYIHIKNSHPQETHSKTNIPVLTFIEVHDECV